MAYEDFSTWTLKSYTGSGNSRYTASSTSITYALQSGDAVYLTRTSASPDSGLSSLVGNWCLQFLYTGGSGGGLLGLTANSQDEVIGFSNCNPTSCTGQSYCGLWFGYNSPGYSLCVREPYVGPGWLAVTHNNTGTPNSTYFVKIKQVGTLCTEYLYTSEAMTTLVDSGSSNNFSASGTYNWFAVTARGPGSGTNAGSISNCTLTMNATSKTVTPSPVGVTVGVSVSGTNAPKIISPSSIGVTTRVKIPPTVPTGNLTYWYEASDLPTGNLTAWVDLKGSNQPMQGATAVVTANAINGKNAVYYNGSQMAQNTVNYSTPYTIFVVARMADANHSGNGDNARVVSSVNNNWLLGWWSGCEDKAYLEGWITSSASSPASTTTNTIVYGVSGNGSNSSLYRDRGTLVANNTGGKAAPNNLTLGGGPGELSKCYVGELIVWNKVLSANEVRQVQDYLLSKWTTQVVKPSVGVTCGVPAPTITQSSVSKTVSLSPVNVSVGVVVPNKANTKSLGSLSIAASVNAPRLTDPNYWVEPSTLGTVTVWWPGTIQTTTTGMVIGDITTFSYKNSLGITTTGYTGVVNAVADGAIYDSNGGVIGIAYATVLGGATTWGSKSGITSGQFLLGGVQSNTKVNFQGFLFIVSVKKPAVAVNAHVNAPTIIKASSVTVSPTPIGVTVGVNTAHTVAPTFVTTQTIQGWDRAQREETGVSTTPNSVVLTNAPSNPRNYIYSWPALPTSGTSRFSGHWRLDSTSGSGDYCFTFFKLSQLDGSNLVQVSYKILSTFNSGNPYLQWENPLVPTSGIISLTPVTEMWWEVQATNNTYTFQAWSDSGRTTQLYKATWTDIAVINPAYFVPWDNYSIGTRTTTGVNDELAVNGNFLSVTSSVKQPLKTNTKQPNSVGVTAAVLVPTITKGSGKTVNPAPVGVSASVLAPFVQKVRTVRVLPLTVMVQTAGVNYLPLTIIISPTINAVSTLTTVKTSKVQNTKICGTSCRASVPTGIIEIIKKPVPIPVVLAICNPTISIYRRRKRKKNFMNTIVRGSTGIIRNVFIENTTNGAGLTGLSSATSGFTVFYKRNLAGSSVAVPLVASSGVTLGVYAGDATHGAIKEIDATHMPGLYEFHFPNNAVSTSDVSDEVTILFFGTGNVANTQLDFSMSRYANATNVGVTL